MNKIINTLLTTIQEPNDGRISSKRIMAISGWIVFLILCFCAISLSPEFVLATLATSVLALAGISSFQTIQTNKQNLDQSNTKES